MQIEHILPVFRRKGQSAYGMIFGETEIMFNGSFHNLSDKFCREIPFDGTG